MGAFRKWLGFRESEKEREAAALKEKLTGNLEHELTEIRELKDELAIEFAEFVRKRKLQ